MDLVIIKDFSFSFQKLFFVCILSFFQELNKLLTHVIFFVKLIPIALTGHLPDNALFINHSEEYFNVLPNKRMLQILLFKIDNQIKSENAGTG